MTTEPRLPLETPVEEEDGTAESALPLEVEKPAPALDVSYGADSGTLSTAGLWLHAHRYGILCVILGTPALLWPLFWFLVALCLVLVIRVYRAVRERAIGENIGVATLIVLPFALLYGLFQGLMAMIWRAIAIVVTVVAMIFAVGLVAAGSGALVGWTRFNDSGGILWADALQSFAHWGPRWGTFLAACVTARTLLQPEPSSRAEEPAPPIPAERDSDLPIGRQLIDNLDEIGLVVVTGLAALFVAIFALPPPGYWSPVGSFWQAASDVGLGGVASSAATSLAKGSANATLEQCPAFGHVAVTAEASGSGVRIDAVFVYSSALSDAQAVALAAALEHNEALPIVSEYTFAAAVPIRVSPSSVIWESADRGLVFRSISAVRPYMRDPGIGTNTATADEYLRSC